MISGSINGIAVNSSIPCSSGNYENCSSRAVSFVVMHYTGNSKDTAKANANYFKTSGRSASAHIFVDDDSIYQSVELRDKAWHCGASSYNHASCRNANSIGIEMCCTAGNYKISDTTKKNAAYVCAYICNLLGITADQVDTYVLRHYDVTGKNCPAQMAGSSNSEWTSFKSMVKSILGGSSATASSSSSSSGVPYQVKVTITNLNIRKGAGVGYAKTGKYTGKGTFTITEEKQGAIDSKGTIGTWGKLKSGAGWICLSVSGVTKV